MLKDSRCENTMNNSKGTMCNIKKCNVLTVKIWVANCSLARGLCKSTNNRARSSYIKHKLFNQVICAEYGKRCLFLTIDSTGNYKI